MSDGESWFNKRPQKKNLSREVYYSQVLEEEHGTPAELTRGGQGELQIEGTTGPGVYAFTKVYGWSALGFSGQGWIGQFKPK